MKELLRQAILLQRGFANAQIEKLPADVGGASPSGESHLGFLPNYKMKKKVMSLI
jgi:hypothetical protein